MPYIIIKRFSSEELEAEVSSLEGKGWRPSGGISVTAYVAEQIVVLINITEVKYKLLYCQAMIKD
jgi:predicted Co/Zn/Cd cation transporter (cation efflux family)